MSPEEQAIAERITELRQELGDKLMILGHHYQRDSIVMHADFIGDSFMLSQKAADSNAEFIVFCGVHFMAESADILTDDDQSVILPNLRAGCSMADMATLPDVESAWSEILSETGLSDPINRQSPGEIPNDGKSYLIPVTYMNSSADLKDFVGRHGGIVCTHQMQLESLIGLLKEQAPMAQCYFSQISTLEGILGFRWELARIRCRLGCQR